jgi:hypothetical protein
MRPKQVGWTRVLPARGLMHGDGPVLGVQADRRGSRTGRTVEVSRAGDVTGREGWEQPQSARSQMMSGGQKRTCMPLYCQVSG